MSSEDEVIRNYQSELNDLTFNSKPIINSLTIIAGENLQYAKAIVKAISDRIRRVTPDKKLPSLYLMDSICKNIGGVYADAFASDIVNLFCETYRSSDMNMRNSLVKLYQTWGPVFPVERMSQIELFLQASGRPTTSTSSTAPPAATNTNNTFVNPKFVNKTNTTATANTWPSLPTQQQPTPIVPTIQTPQTPPTTAELGQQLLQVTQQIQALQQQAQIAGGLTADQWQQLTILSQLFPQLQQQYQLQLQQQAQIQQQVLQLIQSTPALAMLIQTNPALLQMLQSNPQGLLTLLMSQQSILTPQQPQIQQQQQIPTFQNAQPQQIETGLTSHQSDMLKAFLQNSSTQPQTQQPQPTMSTQTQTQQQTNIQKTQTQTQPKSEKIAQKPVHFADPFSPEALKYRNEKSVDSLYDDMPQQCRICGTRFAKNELLDKHLDWHYEKNTRTKEKTKKVISRNWYFKVNDWIENSSVANQTAATSFFAEIEADAQEKEKEKEKELSVGVAVDESQLFCPVCGEKFERIYDQQTEEWVYKGTIIHDGKILHRQCFEIQSSPKLQRIGDRSGNLHNDSSSENLSNNNNNNENAELSNVENNSTTNKNNETLLIRSMTMSPVAPKLNFSFDELADENETMEETNQEPQSTQIQAATQQTQSANETHQPPALEPVTPPDNIVQQNVNENGKRKGHEDEETDSSKRQKIS